MNATLVQHSSRAVNKPIAGTSSLRNELIHQSSDTHLETSVEVKEGEEENVKTEDVKEEDVKIEDVEDGDVEIKSVKLKKVEVKEEQH